MPAQLPNSKTILISLDGVNHKTLGELAKQDTLPFFKKLLTDNPVHTTSTIFPTSEAVDLLCGVSSAVHGFYAHQQLKTGKYRLMSAHPDSQNVIPFTNYLEENGLKSLLIDVPYAELAQKTKAVTSLNSLSGDGLLAESINIKNLRNQKSNTDTSPDMDISLSKNQSANTTVTGSSLAEKIKFTKFALTQEQWDFAYIDLGDSWQQYESSNDDRKNGASDNESDNIQYIYRLLDRAIAEITQHLTSHDNIIIVSRSRSAEIPLQQFVEPVLCQLGLLKLNETDVNKPNEEQIVDAANTGFKYRLLQLFSPVQARLSSLFKPNRILWEETRAFQLPGDRNSYIRINLLGREPQGIVTPGVEYDGLLKGIAAELHDLKVEPGGQKAIKKISFPRRDWTGPHHDSLPDIAIEWNHELSIRGLDSSSVSVRSGSCVEMPRQEDTTGFILVAGNDVQSRPLKADVDFRSIASTVLELFSLEIPKTYPLPSLVKQVHTVSKHLQKVAS